MSKNIQRYSPTIIIVVMSNNHRCPICKKAAVEPLNLRCQHHPCYQCAQNITTVDQSSKIQVKYQIVCTTCSKKTVFYDLRHLILVPQSSAEEELFVTDRFISTKAQPKFMNTPRGDSSGGESIQITRRGSIQSIANSNKMLVEVKCSQHNEIYKYFCADCCDKGNRCLVCAECSKPHYSGGHRLLTLKQAESRLLNFNMRNKEEMMIKNGDIIFLVQNLTANRAVIGDHYRKLEQSLSTQFEKVMQSLNKNYQQVKATLHEQFTANMQEIEQSLQKLYSHQSILESLKEIELKDLETSMKFYQTYQKYTITNQLSQIKTEIDLSRLPILIPKVDQLAALAAEWMALALPEASQTSKAKHRKKSGLEEQFSHRSVREKENKRIALCQANFNFKKGPN